MSSETDLNPFKKRRNYMVIIGLAWVIAMSSSLVWNLVQNERTTKDLALAEAKANYSKDIIYRKWASMHGGVYVPVTDKTSPNKYLSEIKERDIITESGRRLTLVNPAYMTRQVHELGLEQYGVKGHITSLKPIRPENAPDEWERKVLSLFEKGEKEVSAFEEIEGEKYLRYMMPMITEASCLKCHEFQGYREGEVRGGISVSVSYSPYAKTAAVFRYVLISSHMLIMIFGIVGLWISARLLGKTERSLIESEERYRALFEYSKDPAVTLHISSFSLTDANRAASELFGFKDEDSVRFLSPAEISPEFQKDGRLSSEKSHEMTMIAVKNGFHTFEWTHKTIEGKEFPATVQLTRIDIKGDEFIHAVIRDISQQRKSEEELQIMHNRLKAISDNLPDGVIYQMEIDVNGDRRFTYLSAGIIPIHGITPEEGIRDVSLLYRSIHRDDAKRLEEAENESIRTLSVFRMEARIIHTDGTLRWVLLNSAPRKTVDGRIVFDGVEIDITRLKNVEKTLRESRERLNEAQRIAHLGNWEVDLHSRNLIWSDETYKIFEIVPDSADYLKDIFRERIHPEDRKSVDEAYEASLSNSAPCEIEHRLLMPDGRIKYVHASWEILFDIEGNPEKTMGTIQDITHAKLAEFEKEKLQTQLLQSQKVESIGRLAGGVAHDFNNMLGVIIGHADLALSSIDMDNPITEDLNEILSAAKRSADLTGQLLAFARKQSAAPKILDLNETIHGMLKMLRRLIGEDINLIWNPYDDLWLVSIDPSQIDQILANLLVNSRDAISGTGKITISTQNKTIDDFYCKTQPDSTPGDYVLLSVSDNGCGMDKNTREQIFEPFFSTKEKGRGTGLGLATVYGIVRQNEGFVNVYSEKGTGSTFMIYLPRKSGESKSERLLNANEMAYGNGETILLVEDEPAFLRLVKNMLSQLGYNVITSECPNEAIRISSGYSGRIDLLMTDIIMPEINGRDLSLKILETRPGIKCLFMSGYTADIIANRGIIEDNISFIQKPFSLREIANGVKAALSKEDQITS